MKCIQLINSSSWGYEYKFLKQNFFLMFLLINNMFCYLFKILICLNKYKLKVLKIAFLQKTLCWVLENTH